jgi:hypothetical protein
MNNLGLFVTYEFTYPEPEPGQNLEFRLRQKVAEPPASAPALNTAEKQNSPLGKKLPKKGTSTGTKQQKIQELFKFSPKDPVSILS